MPKKRRHHRSSDLLLGGTCELRPSGQLAGRDCRLELHHRLRPSDAALLLRDEGEKGRGERLRQRPDGTLIGIATAGSSVGEDALTLSRSIEVQIDAAAKKQRSLRPCVCFFIYLFPFRSLFPIRSRTRRFPFSRLVFKDCLLHLHYFVLF